MPSEKRTVRRLAKPARRPPWSWSRACWTNAGMSRSRRKPSSTKSSLLLDLRSLARLDVFLQGLHVLSNALCVLALEQSAGEAQESAKLVVHLVHDMGRAIVLLRIAVRPRALQRAAREPASAPLRFHKHGLLDLERRLEPAGKVEQVAVLRALAGRSVAELFDLGHVRRPPRRVLGVFLDDRPHA